MLMFLTLVVGLLFGAQAHAQSSDVVPHPVTKADNFNIPESLRAEHQSSIPISKTWLRRVSRRAKRPSP